MKAWRRSIFALRHAPSSEAVDIVGALAAPARIDWLITLPGWDFSMAPDAGAKVAKQ